MTGLLSVPIEVLMNNQLIVIFHSLLHSNGKHILCQCWIGIKCGVVTSCRYCPLSSSTFIKEPERNFPNQLFTVLEKISE